MGCLSNWGSFNKKNHTKKFRFRKYIYIYFLIVIYIYIIHMYIYIYYTHVYIYIIHMYIYILYTCIYIIYTCIYIDYTHVYIYIHVSYIHIMYVIQSIRQQLENLKFILVDSWIRGIKWSPQDEEIIWLRATDWWQQVPKNMVSEVLMELVSCISGAGRVGCWTGEGQFFAGFNRFHA